MQQDWTTYDLDLTELDTITDPARLAQIVGSLAQADSDFKIAASRQWMENFLYYTGLRGYDPRAAYATVTNRSLGTPGFNGPARRRRIPKLFKACQVLAATVTKNRPSVKVWPVDDTSEANRKARLSNLVLDYLWPLDYEDDLHYEAFLWALLTPAVARKDYLDYSFNRAKLWPVLRRTMDQLTGQPGWEPDTTPEGDPLVEQHPWHRAEIVSAHRLIFNPTANWVNNLDFIADVSIRRLSWVKQNYVRNEPGYYPQTASQVQHSLWSYTPILSAEMALKQLAYGHGRTMRNTSFGMMMPKDGVIHIDLYVRPCPAYPKGREIVVVGGDTVYDGAVRTYREDVRAVWHPYALMTYERVPGRLWGTSYAEKLTDLQSAYEQARMEFDQMRRTVSKPKMALPIGAQVDRDTITGEEQVLRYNPFGPDGGRPQYLNAPQPPTTIMDDTKLMNQEFVEASGITEILMGINPSNVTTYRQTEILREEANNVQQNAIRQYEQLIRVGQTNKLELIRMSLKQPDQTLIQALRVFKKMNSYIMDTDIQQFIGTDLAGYVQIEPYSSLGKSRLAQQEKLSAMAQQGVLGDVVHDPELNSEYKRKMDVMGFDMPMNKQVEYARWENSLMLQADQKQVIMNPPVYEWHDDVLHLREVDNLLLDPAVMEKQLVVQSLLAHRQSHLQQQAMKMMQQAQQMAMMGGGAMGLPGAPAPQQPRTPPAALGGPPNSEE